MQLRQEANSEMRKKFHLISKLRKACGYATQLETLCNVSYLLILTTLYTFLVYTLIWLQFYIENYFNFIFTDYFNF